MMKDLARQVLGQKLILQAQDGLSAMATARCSTCMTTASTPGGYSRRARSTPMSMAPFFRLSNCVGVSMGAISSRTAGCSALKVLSRPGKAPLVTAEATKPAFTTPTSPRAASRPYLNRLVDVLERDDGMRVESPARVRQRYRLSLVSMQQLDSQLGLKLLDGDAQDGLGDAQAVRRLEKCRLSTTATK